MDMNMFKVSFESTEDIKKIYRIKHVFNTVVQVEPVKQQRSVPQYRNCLLFGHTKNYCNKQPRYVKCAGKQFAWTTFRSCIVAKDLQNRRNNNFKSRTTTSGEMYENFNLNRLTYANDQQANKSREPQNLRLLNNPFKQTVNRTEIKIYLMNRSATRLKLKWSWKLCYGILMAWWKIKER